MKGHYQKKFNNAFMLLLLVSVGHFSFIKYRQSIHISYWEKSQESLLAQSNLRSPSSHHDFNQDAIENIKTYFDFSTFKKYVNYDLILDFKSDVEELKSASKWRPLFHRSLERTLTPHSDEAKSLESIFLTAFNDNLLHDFTGQFKDELEKRQIKKGRFQVDIIFKPKLMPQFSYTPELSSNKLINWKKTNTFMSGIKKSIKEKEVSLTSHILNTTLPNTSTNYQYKGGVISIWFELESAQKLSGFVRFRKYFSAPHISKLEPYISEEDFRLTMIHFKNSENNPSGELFITGDFYQSFSLSEPKPVAQRLELHFGKLLPNHLSKKNLGSRGLASLTSFDGASSLKKPLDLGELNFHGVAKYDKKDYLFKSKIDSLVFDFQSGEFHGQKSKIKTIIKDKNLKGHRRGALKHRVSQKLLKEHGFSLIQNFQLQSLHPRFKGAKGKRR